MTSLSLAPADLSLICVDGDDLSLSFTITEDGTPYPWSGVTVASSIVTLSGAAAAVTSFTTATPTDGTLTAALTDVQTGTLGPGTYRYSISFTEASLTRTVLAGTLSVMEVGYGGRSTSSATLSITTGSATIAVTGQVTANAAANITVADSAGYYTGTNVETVLAELPTKFAASVQEMPGDSALSVNRIDVFPAELASGTQTPTTQRQIVVYFQVPRVITVNTVSFCGDTTASASLTTGQLGLCYISDDGHVFPAAKSANDATIFNVASTLTSKTFDFGSSWPTAVTLVPGRWYGATLYLDGTTMPSLVAGPAVRNALQGNSRCRRTSVTPAFLDFEQRANMGGLSFNTPWSRYLAGGTANQARTAVLFGDSFFAVSGAGAPTWFGRGNGQSGSRLHPIRVKGASGETLAQINARWSTDVAAYSPEWCILHGGTNDIHTEGASSATVISRLATAIANAQAANIKLMICTPPPNTASTAGMKTILGEVRTYLLALSETNVYVADTGISLSTGDGVTADATKLADTVHPNTTTGRQALADAIDGVIATNVT